MALRFIATGKTDVGKRREANEDAFRLLDSEQVWILADGMGGHASGQIASQMAVEAISDFMLRWRKEPDFEWPFEIMESRSDEENHLVNAVRVANVRLYNRGQIDPECQNMGTTIVVMSYHPQVGLVIAHVGDSRCYRLRGGEFKQLTEDHSLVNHLKRYFHLSDEAARARAGSNVIVKAVGLEDDVEPELTLDQPQVGDIYLSCSDGLSDLVEDWIIQQILRGYSNDLETATRYLINTANRAGGTDNITVIALRVLGSR